MRVAVHLPKGHELARGEGPDVRPHEGGSVFAYKLGRIEEGVHNAPVGHQEIPIEKFVADLVSDAKAEYPDAEVVVERLVDNGDDTASWIPASRFDPAKHQPVGAGRQVARDVSASAKGAGG